MTRRLLILAPAFPPHPSPATHRARFLARYASRADWATEVLTVDPRYYAEALDDALLRLVPTDLRITRVRAVAPLAARAAGVGDLGLRSYPFLLREARRMCRERRPDAVFIPGGPFYQFGIGATLRAEFGVPYVLDFTDPWVFQLTPEQNSALRKAWWARRLAVALEPRAVRHASHIVAVSDGTNEGIRARYPELPSSRFSAMPFGFEPTDFDILREHPRAKRYWSAADGKFHFVYVGAMLPHGYETLRALFAAVLRLRVERPRLADRVRLHFFGTTYDPRANRGLVAPVAEELGLADVVSEHPRRVPYLEALQLLLSADGILGLGSTEHHYTASKIFPCILARRPLLAIYHEASTVCDIVRATNAGHLVTYGDERRADACVADIAGAIERMVIGGDAAVPASPRFEFLEQYSAERMSLAIYDVLDRVVDDATKESEWEVGTSALPVAFHA